jgi:putative effector of murein hydrolase LrgA (UPF0299 family)
MVKSLIRNLIIGAVAAVGGAVYFMVNGGSFSGVIPGIIIGIAASFVGLALKWVLFNLFHATKDTLPDILLYLLLPAGCAFFGSYIGAGQIAQMFAK